MIGESSVIAMSYDGGPYGLTLCIRLMAEETVGTSPIFRQPSSARDKKNGPNRI